MTAGRIRIDFESPPRRTYVKRKFNVSKVKKKFRTIESNRDIIKSSTRIRNLLIERIKELNLSYDMIITDARKNGMNIKRSELARYFDNEVRHGNIISQLQILWLMSRLCIDIDFTVKKSEYNERIGLMNIKKFN